MIIEDVSLAQYTEHILGGQTVHLMDDDRSLKRLFYGLVTHGV